MFYSYEQREASLPWFFQRCPIAHILCAQEAPFVFSPRVFTGDVVCKDVLKSFRNLLQGGDRTSAKKLDEDLHILWASKGGNVDLSKWSRWFQHFASKPVTTNNFGLVLLQRKSFTNTFWRPQFSISWLQKQFRSPVGACWKKLILDPGSAYYLMCELGLSEPHH